MGDSEENPLLENIDHNAGLVKNFGNPSLEILDVVEVVTGVSQT
jgi:hypothetical protein